MNTLIKAAAIAVTTAFIGGTATAQSAFGVQEATMGDQTLTINLVVADDAGTVAIYEYSGGTLGEMIGTAPVNAGANADVEIALDRSPSGPRVVALLFEGDAGDMDPMIATARVQIDVEM